MLTRPGPCPVFPGKPCPHPGECVLFGCFNEAPTPPTLAEAPTIGALVFRPHPVNARWSHVVFAMPDGTLVSIVRDPVTCAAIHGPDRIFNINFESGLNERFDVDPLAFLTAEEVNALLRRAYDARAPWPVFQR